MSAHDVSICFLRTCCLFPPQIDLPTSWKTNPTASAQLLCIRAVSLHLRSSRVGLISLLLRWRWCRVRWPKILTSYMEKPEWEPGQDPRGCSGPLTYPYHSAGNDQSWNKRLRVPAQYPCLGLQGLHSSTAPLDRELSVLVSFLKHGQNRTALGIYMFIRIG